MDKNVHLPVFIIKSSYRKDVLLNLVKHPNQTQSQIKEHTSPKYRSHMSRTMKELLDKELISCYNPKDHAYKIYFPTELGVKIAEEVHSYGKPRIDKKDL